MSPLKDFENCQKNASKNTLLLNFSENMIQEETERAKNDLATSPRIENIKHQAKIVEFQRY